MTLTDIGAALKRARTEAGMTQDDLARPVGMSRATISALESGRCEELGFAKLSALLGMVGLEITVAPRRGRPTVDDLREERRRT